MPPRPSPSAFAGQCAGGGKRLSRPISTDKVLTDGPPLFRSSMAWTAPRRPIWLYNGESRIYTTVDPDPQAVMENALERGYSSFSPPAGCGNAGHEIQ